MPILHVRNVPEELYERLRRKAADQGGTLNAEVIALLNAAINRRTTIVPDVLDRISQQRKELERLHGQFPNSVDEIRADRER